MISALTCWMLNTWNCWMKYFGIGENCVWCFMIFHFRWIMKWPEACWKKSTTNLPSLSCPTAAKRFLRTPESGSTIRYRENNFRNSLWRYTDITLATYWARSSQKFCRLKTSNIKSYICCLLVNGLGFSCKYTIIFQLNETIKYIYNFTTRFIAYTSKASQETGLKYISLHL